MNLNDLSRRYDACVERVEQQTKFMVMSKHLLTVMTHQGAHETFMRHYPEWKKHGTDILIFATEEPYRIDLPHEVLQFGHAEHHGPESIRRFRFLLSYLAQKPYETFSIFEYDSFCLSVGMPGFTLDGLAGNVFRDDQPDRGFVGTHYVHPPLLFSKATLDKLLVSAEALSDHAEGCYWDRWIGLAGEMANVPFLDYLTSNIGFARNTIEPTQIQDAVDAVKNGAVYLHGVKTKECYDAIKAAYRDQFKRS